MKIIQMCDNCKLIRALMIHFGDIERSDKRRYKEGSCKCNLPSRVTMTLTGKLYELICLIQGEEGKF